MSSFKYFLTLMTGTSLGLIAGYIAGTQKDKLGNNRIGKELKSIKGSLGDAALKDIEDIKKEYNSQLQKTVEEAKSYLDEAREKAKAK